MHGWVEDPAPHVTQLLMHGWVEDPAPHVTQLLMHGWVEDPAPHVSKQRNNINLGIGDLQFRMIWGYIL